MVLREFRRHVGRLAIVGFNGQTVPDDLRRLAAEFDLGGVIYFRRNVVEPSQVRDLSREVRTLEREWPFWVSVDQEGGRVARLTRPFTEWPPAATLGRNGTDALAVRFAEALSRELLAVGINLDYLPVLDVHTNPANPVIGDRAFSDRADVVARLGEVFVRTFQAQGIATCGKHFPGHGDTSVDSHDALPIVEHERDRLAAVELVPFRQAIAAGVATIMTAHVVVPAYDAERPATMAPALVTALLKQQMAFGGVVISDDLGMKAVAATTPLPEATVAAIEAGCDAVLLCNSTADEQAVALEALIRAAESGRLPAKRIDDALARQEAAKLRVRRPAEAPPVPLEAVGSLAHQAVADEMAAWA